MNKLLRLFLLQVCVCVFASVPLYAQSPEEIQFYRDAYAKVANNYRTAIRQYLPMTDRRILDRIRFKFSSSQEFFAVAYIDDREQRVIEVSFGFLVLMENITFAYAASGEASDEECFWHYLDAAGQALLENTRRRLSGSKQRDLVPFFHHYVQEDGFGCELISVRDLRNPAARDFIPGGMDSVLAILIGHEVAHHLLGHLDRGGAARCISHAALRPPQTFGRLNTHLVSELIPFRRFLCGHFSRSLVARTLEPKSSHRIPWELSDGLVPWTRL